jgi:hypothetical protein
MFLSTAYPFENNYKDFSNVSEEQNKNNFGLSFDFLNWYSSQEPSAIFADVISSSSWDARGFQLKWDLGFRAGLGYQFLNDNWDIKLDWTWFETDKTNNISFEENASITPEFFAAFLSGNKPQKMSVKWRVLLNAFDLKLGKKYWLEDLFFFRFFLGIKNAFINQAIHGRYFDLIINDIKTNNLGNEKVKNDFWGIGPLAGVDTKWKIKNLKNYFFNIFFDFSLATMWGDFKVSDLYKDITKTSSVNSKNSNLGGLSFRGFTGIEWNVFFNKNKSEFTTKIGYETQIFFNQLRIATFQLQRLHNDLTFQGITFNLGFDF